MTLFVVAVVSLLVATQAALISEDFNSEWEAFKTEHGKLYNSEVEERFRKMIFIDNWHKIEKHNKRFLKGEVSFDLGMNSFGDRLHHEFVATMNGLKVPPHIDNSSRTTFLAPENVEVPSSIDWVKKGYVTGVKNQGECGSCYSFSATGALEGQHKRKTGKLVSLSEQNIVDCSQKFGNQGCDGGFPDYVFKYIKANKGVDTETSYPYEAAVGKCRFQPADVGATDKGTVKIKSGSESQMKQAVGTIGPVSVGIDASQDSFQFYKSGVYDEPKCSSTELDHAVLVAGYGTYKGKDFWLVKNSWGNTWGMKGYVRMARNKKNQCGIATESNFPKV